MITEKQRCNRSCLFCVSDYHLEMILLPYIMRNINNSKFFIFTETDLEPSINTLLEKIILNNEDKETVKSINWNNNDFIKLDQIEQLDDERINIIINGSKNYINNINEIIKKRIKKNIEIVDCFHIGEQEINVEEISKKYNRILNTQKL